MTEEDAQTAALQEYFDSSTPAGYGASFRAGWNAGRVYAVGICTYDREQSRDAYADDVRQAALRLTTEYLAHPEITLAELKPDFVRLIEALDGVAAED